MSDMADVLGKHGIWGYNGSEIACKCNRRNWISETGFAAHQAAALSAAGFGLVADAGAKALEDAADDILKDQPVFVASWLRARAVAVRGEG